jgi:hypothetical protein
MTRLSRYKVCRQLMLPPDHPDNIERRLDFLPPCWRRDALLDPHSDARLLPLARRLAMLREINEGVMA